ncbi:hypothetical protein [Dyadobacter chenhuakuii]|uniref:Uncharacterized protein n=1 Tax=Dyadobacter chenhuakuii TaxID=2909339 RepID=A0A9X1TQT3_9BACT|nr:hypothetical protein [Dyadobacter chenhuakuii]MCF2497169.1 hypothetical protein [Dyadobacter chenhuakuii]
MATLTKSGSKPATNKPVRKFVTAEEAVQAKYGNLLKTIEKLNLRVVQKEDKE